MQGNILGQISGGSSGLNVYAQANEPSKKEGIWINTSATGDLPRIDKFKYEKIELTDVEFGNIGIYTDLASISYSFASGLLASVGTDIYMFGTSYNPNSDGRRATKYDTLANSYSGVSNTPYKFIYGSTIAIGTDIYLFGGDENKRAAYKYNTLTGAYTKLTDIPYELYSGSVVAVGSNIYLFGGYYGQNSAYKYNTLTDTYTKLTDIPYIFYGGSAVAVGTDIYLFGSSYYETTYIYSKYMYKYNTLTNTYERMDNLPEENSYTASIGTDIYLFCTQKSYKYDTVSEEMVEIQKIELTSGSKILVGTELYFFGGSTYGETMNAYKCTIPFLKNNYIYIIGSEAYKLKLNKKVSLHFNKAQLYKDDEIKNYPCYYGNGIAWNAIAN